MESPTNGWKNVVKKRSKGLCASASVSMPLKDILPRVTQQTPSITKEELLELGVIYKMVYTFMRCIIDTQKRRLQ